MDRITPAGLDAMSPRARELVERVPLHDGAPPHLFSYMASHEGLFPVWFRLTMSLLTKGELTQRQREIAIVRTALHADSDYELAQHVELARKAGVSDIEFASLLTDGAALDDLERDLIAFVDELASRGDVGDETWARVSARLGQQRMMELSMLVAYYQALATLLRVFRVPLEAGMTDPR